MRYLKYILFCALFSSKVEAQLSRTIALSSQQPEIDTIYRECLYASENQVYQMMGCGNKAKDAWDEEMEKYYNLLMGVLIAPEREKLKIAQKRWLAYKKSEFEFAGTTYYNLQGTIWSIVALDKKVEIVKHRAMELKTYYETLTEKYADY